MVSGKNSFRKILIWTQTHTGAHSPNEGARLRWVLNTNGKHIGTVFQRKSLASIIGGVGGKVNMTCASKSLFASLLCPSKAPGLLLKAETELKAANVEVAKANTLPLRVV